MTKDEIKNLTVHISYEDTYKISDIADSDYLDDIMEDYDPTLDNSVIDYIKCVFKPDLEDLDYSKLKIDVK